MSKDNEPLSNAIMTLSKISVPNISDAMAKGLSKKFKHQTMDSGIMPIDRSFKVCAPAYTVRCYPGATWAMELAVEQAPAGSVIVCDAQGSDAGVMMGELMSATAKVRGVVGAVIDGAVRDIEEVIKMKFPLFSRHIVARSGTFDQIGDAQISITCGGVVINPGDIVAGDCNGVTIIPKEIINQVAQASLALSKWEDNLFQLIQKGKTLSEAAKAFPKPPILEVCPTL
jgi:4-hydroxy-4-methyl-2-oxoglutarate aldolase